MTEDQSPGQAKPQNYRRPLVYVGVLCVVAFLVFLDIGERLEPVGSDDEASQELSRLQTRIADLDQALNDYRHEVVMAGILTAKDSIQRLSEELQAADNDQRRQSITRELASAEAGLTEARALRDVAILAVFDPQRIAGTDSLHRNAEQYLQEGQRGRAIELFTQLENDLAGQLARTRGLEPLVAPFVRASAARGAWMVAANKAGLRADPVAGRIDRLFSEAENQTRAGQFEAAIASFNRLASLAADAAVFARAKAEGSIDELLDYRNLHPDGAYVDAVDGAVWNVTNSLGSIAALDRYLELFPEGSYAAAARQRRADLLSQRKSREEERQSQLHRLEQLADRVRTVEEARNFLASHPTGPLADEIRQRKYPLLVMESTRGSAYEPGQSRPGQMLTVTHEYDRFGNRVAERRGRQGQESKAATIREWQYNALADVTLEKSTVAGWSEAAVKQYRYEYDKSGKKTKRHSINPRTGETAEGRYTYNPAGQLLADPDCWRYEYDDKGRLVRKYLSDRSEWKYTYNEEGQVIAEYEAGPGAWTRREHQYSDGHRSSTVVTGVKTSAGVAVPFHRQIDYTYDPSGNLESRYEVNRDTGKWTRTTYRYEKRQIDFNNYLVGLAQRGG